MLISRSGFGLSIDYAHGVRRDTGFLPVARLEVHKFISLLSSNVGLLDGILRRAVFYERFLSNTIVVVPDSRQLISSGLQYQ